MERLHRQLLPGQIHTPFQWIFEDDSDKALITVGNTKPIDCGKLAYKKDDQGIYILLNNDPIQWAHLNNVSFIDDLVKNYVTRDELGTAAFVNTGTNVGDIPVIGSGGKLSSNIIPIISKNNISGLGTAANYDIIVVEDGKIVSGNVVVLDSNGKIPSDVINISDLGTQVIEGLGTAAFKNIGTEGDTVPTCDHVPILDDNNKIPLEYNTFVGNDNKILNSYLSIFDSNVKILKTLLPTDIMYTGNYISNNKIKEECIPCLEKNTSGEYKVSNSYLNTDPDDGNAIVLFNNLFDILDSNGFVAEDKTINANSSITLNPSDVFPSGYDLRSAAFSIKVKENDKYYTNVETLNNIWIEFSGVSNQTFIVHNDNNNSVVVYVAVSF